MKRSKKASSPVTAPNQEASAAAAEAKTASRRKAARNHERYTVQKPFAGGHNFGPGKGLRRV